MNEAEQEMESVMEHPIHLSSVGKWMQISDMENLSPHKEFKGPELIKPTFRPFYRFKWPKDLPAECPICGNKFYTGLNLRTDTNLTGRILRKAWIYSIVPCTFMGFLAEDLFRDTYRKINEFSEELTALSTLSIFFLPAFLCFLSRLSPATRTVSCLKCDWKREFPALKVSLGEKKKSI